MPNFYLLFHFIVIFILIFVVNETTVTVMESVNISIGEQAVFHCLCNGSCPKFHLEWRVNGMYMYMFAQAGLGKIQIEGQGNVTSTWEFTVSPAIAALLNNSNVSCLALPLYVHHSQKMNYESDPVLLLIQGNPVEEFIQCFTNIHTKLHVCMHKGSRT